MSKIDKLHRIAHLMEALDEDSNHVRGGGYQVSRTDAGGVLIEKYDISPKNGGELEYVADIAPEDL